MSLYAFLIVLSAAFCHATWNYFVKRVNGGPELVWLFSLLSVLIYLPIAVYVFVVDQPAFDQLTIGFIAGSTLLHLGYFLLLQRGYRKGDLSVVYPTARATGPLLSTLLAVSLLGESITWQAGIGAIVIVVGVLFLTGGVKQRAKHIVNSLLFGVGAGLLIGSYTAWDAYTVTALAVPPILLDYASSIGRTILLAPYALRHKQSIKAHWVEHKIPVCLIAVFNPLAYILVLYALTFTPVVYVAPTRELSVLLSVMMGAWFLGEGEWRNRLLWATLILVGVSLLATG